MSKVKLSDVAIESREVYKGDKSGMPIVGLEHLTPENVVLSNWDHDTENTFTKMFRKGDMLFGRRRAYLKKAALAPFDGICSGDITVIRAKSDKLLPELLPFIIQNENLFDFAVGKSAGSLSPRVKWENLQNFTFELPSLEEQKKLAAVLWSINDTLQAYQNLLKQTDELVKSQFVEMFGNCKRQRLGDFIQQVRGVSYKPADLSLTLDDNHMILLRANNISNGVINFDEVQYVDKKKVSEVQKIKYHDILMCASSGSLEHVGKAALCELGQDITFGAFCKLIRVVGPISAEYISAYFQSDEYRQIISDLAHGTNINNLRNEHIDELLIPVPDKTNEETFVEFLFQSKKSKTALQNAITAAQVTKRSIITDALGITGKE